MSNRRIQGSLAYHARRRITLVALAITVGFASVGMVASPAVPVADQPGGCGGVGC